MSLGRPNSLTRGMFPALTTEGTIVTIGSTGMGKDVSNFEQITDHGRRPRRSGGGFRRRCAQMEVRYREHVGQARRSLAPAWFFARSRHLRGEKNLRHASVEEIYDTSTGTTEVSNR